MSGFKYFTKINSTCASLKASGGLLSECSVSDLEQRQLHVVYVLQTITDKVHSRLLIDCVHGGWKLFQARDNYVKSTLHRFDLAHACVLA